MENILDYNSWKDKAPFGALKINESMEIEIGGNDKYKIRNIALVILKEDNIIYRIDLRMKEDNQSYICKVDGFAEKGLYFYYFEVDIEREQGVERRFYGKSNEDSKAVEYSYEQINKYQITVYEDFQVPGWYKEGVVYHIFVDRFNNGNRNNKPSDPKKNSFIYANWSDTPMYIKDENGDIIRWDFYGGNLKGIIDKIGYLKKLGISVIYLSPIFESTSNHKYNTGDYKKIDSMFGDEEIFKELVNKASQKGISIVLDGVFSHTGADSKYFNKFGNYNEIGAYQSENSKFSSWYKFDEFPEKYKSWWDIKDLPNVDEMEESYIDYIIRDEDSVIKKWTKLGAKGWRLDVADELPSLFIEKLRKELKSIDNDSVLAGEVWEDASNKISYEQRRGYLLGNQLDSVMGYPFRQNIIDFLKGNITSEQLNNRFMQIKENYPKESFRSNLNLISSHDVARIKTILDYDVEMVKLAVAVQATFEGIPYIYYGDEAGVDGGTDPENRKTYPWKNEDKDMLDFYKEAISTRRKNNVLTNGETMFIDTKNDNVFGYIRYNEEGEKTIVLINRSKDIQTLSLNIQQNMLEELDIEHSSKKYLEILNKEDELFNIEINPKSCRIFNAI